MVEEFLIKVSVRNFPFYEVPQQPRILSTFTSSLFNAMIPGLSHLPFTLHISGG